MGAQISKLEQNNQNIVNAVSTAMVQMASTCTTSTTGVQTIDVKNVSGDVTVDGGGQSQTIDLNFSCTSDQANEATLKNNIKEALESVAKAAITGQTIGAQVNLSDVTNTQIANVTNSISTSQLSACAANTIAKQQLNIDGVGGNVIIRNFTQKQAITAVTDCVLKSTNTANAINELATSLTAQQSNSTAGIDFTAIFYLLIVAVVAFLAFFFIIKRKK